VIDTDGRFVGKALDVGELNEQLARLLQGVRVSAR
jgi:hypothetical protein